MNNFKRVNTILGWVSFVIALVVYTLTLEPSVSLWDCGEFISASYRLQVVHPPGAECEDNWNERFRAYNASYPKEAAEFKRRMSGKLPDNFAKKMDEYILILRLGLVMQLL